MADKKTNRKLIWFSIIFLVLIVVILASVVDFDKLVKTIKRADPVLFVGSVACLVTGIMFITIRWRFLLQNEPRFTAVFYANSISYMLKMFVPFPLPMTRVMTLSFISPVDYYHSIPMMAVEWFLETVMRLVALILAFVLFMDFSLWIALLIVLGILLFGVPAFIVWISRGTSHKISRFIEKTSHLSDIDKDELDEEIKDFQTYLVTREGLHRVTIAVLYSLVLWGFFLLFYVLGFYALQLRLNDWEVLTMSAVVLAFLPPSTPATIGVYQGVIMAVLLPFGYIDVDTATAYGILMFGAQIAIWVVLGIWGLLKTGLNLRSITQI